MFPLGLAMLATIAKGSAVASMTTGMTPLAFLAAKAAGVPLVRMRSTFKRRSSAVNSGNRSG
jgi:hypothetical protein